MGDEEMELTREGISSISHFPNSLVSNVAPVRSGQFYGPFKYMEFADSQHGSTQIQPEKRSNYPE